MKTLWARLGSALAPVLAQHGRDLLALLLVAAVAIEVIWLIASTPWSLH